MTVNEQNNFGRICAVVVTYNIGERYQKSFDTLKNQVDKVIIVDNGSDPSTIGVLQQIQKNFKDKVNIILNEKNVGVAKAQNIGIARAIDEGFEWVLLLDHDSLLKENMVHAMKNLYQSLGREMQEKIAIVAPNIMDINVNLPSKFTTRYLKIFFKREKCSEKKYIDALTVIASGSLIKTLALKRIGLMKEEFFIDFIDTEFSLRVISNGFKIIVVCDAILYHSLGERRVYKIFTIRFKPTFHSPQRRFYIFRNRVKVLKSYICKVPSFAFLDFVRILYDIFNITFFENDKVSKFRMIVKGILAGLKE